MKIVVAIDSFKGSASSHELNACVKETVNQFFPSVEVKAVAIADGGEGTISALREVLGGEMRTVRTVDLLARPIEASYLKVEQCAFIESASVVGIDKITPSAKTFEKATSYGLGKLIHDAVKQGCKEIYVTLGGSGTSDGGLGLLQSFGFDGTTLQFSYPQGWGDVKLFGLTDVKNVYAGEHGFAQMFGRQKGGNEAQLLARDQEAMDFARWVYDESAIDIQGIPGTGAAGGLGAAIVLLGGHLESGFNQVARIVGLENAIVNASLVITGEGRLDGQSKKGKVPYGVARLAQKHDVPVIAISGSIADDVDWIWDEFLAVFSIQTQILSLEEAMNPERTLSNLKFVMKNILRLFVR